MRNEICNYCEDKKGFCFIGCKKYVKAQLKRAERRMQRRFGDDFDAEDKYTASLIFGWSVVVIVALLMLMSFIKTIGEWFI